MAGGNRAAAQLMRAGTRPGGDTRAKLDKMIKSICRGC
jgi:hypothetical protein